MDGLKKTFSFHCGQKISCTSQDLENGKQFCMERGPELACMRNIFRRKTPKILARGIKEMKFLKFEFKIPPFHKILTNHF